MGTYIPGPTPLVTSTKAGLIPAPPEGEPTGKVFTDALEWAEPPGVGAAWQQGSGVPGADVGSDGDFYLNTANGDIYGPKAAGAWGAVIFNIAEGQEGPAGEPGPAIELQATATHIQWRYVGDTTWTNLVALSAITGAAGADGTDGVDGREVEFQLSATHIQWRYVGDTTWTDLIALSALQGSPGSDGLDGEPGPAIELQATATHIQWRVVGAASWINLVALASLKGDPGDPAPGTDLGYDAATRVLSSSSGNDATLPLLTSTTAGLAPASSFAAITYAAGVELDMAALDGQVRTISLTGNLSLTSINRAAGRSVSLRIVADGSQRTLTFPSEWVFVGTKPANIAASKTGVLSLTFFGSNNADAVAAWGVQS